MIIKTENVIVIKHKSHCTIHNHVGSYNFDPEINYYGIFGSESGFCYGSGEKENLEVQLKEINKCRK